MRLPLARVFARPLLRRALRPIAAFVAVVVAGVLGFMYLGSVGPVEAAFWLVDPTSIELHFADHAGPARAAKLYAVLVLAAQVAAGLWLGETVLGAAFGGQIQEELRSVQTEQAIDDLSGHVVICGYGMFGRTVAARLADDGRDVVVIEVADAERERARESGHLVLDGDARREETLEAAGIGEAAAVVAAIDDSNVNIQIAIAASQLAPDVRTVVRVGEEMYETLARRAGADEVVIPEVVSGNEVTGLL